MGIPGSTFRFLVLFAFLGVTAFSAVGPRVLCVAADGGFAVMEKPQAGGCAGANTPTRPCAFHSVLTTENKRGAVCDDCFDVQLPGLGDQVSDRLVAIDVDLHPLLLQLCVVDATIIAAHAASDRLGHDPPPWTDRTSSLLTTIQLC